MGPRSSASRASAAAGSAPDAFPKATKNASPCVSTSTTAVGGQRRVDASVAHAPAGELLERARVVVEAQRRAPRIERATAERACRRRPDGAVARDLLRAQIGAQGDQLGEVVDCVDGAALL